jgi:hypothetical protein
MDQLEDKEADVNIAVSIVADAAADASEIALVIFVDNLGYQTADSHRWYQELRDSP